MGLTLNQAFDYLFDAAFRQHVKELTLKVLTVITKAIIQLCEVLSMAKFPLKRITQLLA